MKIGVLLSGCGVYDGAEIQESVLTLLAIEEEGHETVCISMDRDQHHVVNHVTGEEMNEKRNMLVEAARIARGKISEISQVQAADIDALVIPGGFGSAKNFTSWAFQGAEGEIVPEIKLLLVNLYNVGKPIVALCVSPVVIAKAFEGLNIDLKLTLGTDRESSPYDIPSFNQGIEKTGAHAEMKSVKEILIDEKNKIISAPCYMMDATVSEIRRNISEAIKSLNKIV